MKSFSRENAIFLLALCAAFSAAAVSLALVSNPRRAVDSKIVGYIAQKSNNVEQRSVGNPIWSQIDAKYPVYDRDTVRTGPSSSATINLGDGVEIAMSEQSMVFIDVSQEKKRLRVSGGLVSVSNARKSSPVRLETRAGSIEVKEGNVQLRDSIGGMNVELRDGEASVTTDGETVTLSEPSILDTASSEVRTISAELIKPGQGDVVLIHSPGERFSMAWYCADNEGARIMIARDANFERVEVDEIARGSSFAATLPEGLHYWKIADKSPVQWFSVAIARAPRQIAPVNVAFTYLDALPVISFLWSEVDIAEEYRFEVFSSEGKDRPAFVKSVYANKITVDTLGAGSYSWRVVAIVGHNGPEIPSTYSSFTVTTAPLRKPVLRMNGDSLGRYALMRGTPAVSWNTVEGAVSYEVVISRDAQGADVERKEVTPVNALRLVNPPTVGEYFVRVRAIAGKVYSEPSDQRRLSIAESHPLVAVSPIKTVSQSKKGGVIDFSWADPNGGSRYLFQLSANDSFEESLVSETIEGRRFSYTADASIPGTLFWKVSLIGSDGTIVATTDAQTVRIIRRLDAAVPTGPVNGERVDINDTNIIRFAWKPVEHAEAYEIDLYRVSAGLSTKVRSWRTGLCEVALENFAGLAIAEYSWAVTANGRADGEYAPSVPVVSYFRITQSSVLPAPRINLMKPDGGSMP